MAVNAVNLLGQSDDGLTAVLRDALPRLDMDPGSTEDGGLDLLARLLPALVLRVETPGQSIAVQIRGGRGALEDGRRREEQSLAGLELDGPMEECAVLGAA